MARLRLFGLVSIALLAIACGDDVTITVDPATKSLLPGESVTFTATVTGSDDTTVAWSLKEGAAGGTVTAEGAYTAPARSGQYQVIATSNADPTKTAAATVTVATSAVLLTGTAPVSPSSDNNPLVQGTAESGSAVKIYAGDDCDGVSLGSGVAGVDGRFEIAVSVPSDATTTFRAQVTSAGGVISDCSASTITYVEDSTSPSPAIVFGTSVTSPGRLRELDVEGTSEAFAKVRAFLDGACESDSLGAGTADDSGAFSVAVLAPANATSRFFVRPEDQAGNVGPCSATSALYVHDDVAPGEATFASISPASPSNENNVIVVGTAEEGTTVALYDGAGCLLKLSEGSAEAFSGDGLSAVVADDRTTRFHAVVTDAAGNASACSSASIVYVEDSTVDAPALDVLTPSSPSTQRTVTLIGTTEELSTVELYGAADCGGLALATAAASSSGSFEFTVEAQANAISTWSARTIDLASNVSSCSGAVTYTHDDTAPASPRMTGVSPVSPAADTTPVISGTAEEGAWVRLFATSGCSGAVLAEGAAVGGQFAFEVTVEEDSSNNFYATATDLAANVSACSTSFVTFVEQSSAVVTLALEPASITLAPGDGTVFVAQVSGTTNLGVEWSVEEAEGGTISASGAYVAPATAGTYHVVATSVADSSVTATAVVTVVEDAPSLTVEPAEATVFVGQSFSFTATPIRFEGVVVWEVSTPDGGNISPEGEYFAPQQPGRFVVVARSEDGTVRGAATVDVRLPEISGVIQAPEGMTGRIFISVRETGEYARWEPVAGTSIEAPGAFTVRGLPRMGTYLVEARMPASGRSSDTTLLDPFAEAEVDLSGGPVEDLTLVLTGEDDESRPPPDMFAVMVHGTGALAMVQPATDGDDRVWTNIHRVYLSTTQPATAENAFFTREVRDRETLVLLPPLEPGVEYFASAVGIYGGEPGPAATFGPFSATTPAEGYSVSGQVHIEGDLPAGDLFVVSAENDDAPVFVRLSATASPVDYTLAGMPEGEQQIAVFADFNGDGLLQSQETRVMEMSMRTIDIAGSDLTDVDLFVRFETPSARLKVSTYASYAPPGVGTMDYFSVMLRAEPGASPFVRASVVAGPLVGLPYDMAEWVFGGPPGFVFSPTGSNQRPVEGTTYTVEAVDADGEVHLLTGVLERVLDAPTATSPLALEPSTTPDFAWSLSQSLPEGSTWNLNLFTDGAHVWSVWDHSASQRSVPWNFDGGANVDALERGRNYNWELELHDADENGARVRYEFTIPLAVEVTPSTLTLSPGGVQTLLGEVIGSPGEQVLFSVASGHGSIDSLGNYTAPSTPGIYTIVARAAGHNDVITTVTVHVVEAPQVMITPVPQQVSTGLGTTVQLNATVSGTTDTRLTWQVVSGEGTVDQEGRFTSSGSPSASTVIATSVLDPSKFAVFFVSALADLPSLELSTSSLRLAPGESDTLVATTDGSGVIWQVIDGAGPTVTDGVVQAGDVPGTYRLVATLVDDPSVTATAILVVAHPDISGVVGVEGAATGRIVIQLYSNLGDFPVAGTVVDGPGSFVIRGVSHRGPAHLVAWMDTSGSLAQKSSDPRTITSIDVTPASQTGVTLELEIPTPELPGAPALEVVSPFDSGAFLYFEPSRTAERMPSADGHRVLVSTNATPDENNSVIIDVPVTSENVVMVPSLINGDSYYFRVAADAPGGTSWSDVIGPVTIGEVTEGITVSGVVEFVSAPQGPLYVGVVGDDFRFVRIESPSQRQAFSIPGVPSGSYEVVALRDANANGTLEAGELQVGATVEVADLPVTGVVLNQTEAALRASIATRTYFSGSNATYGLVFMIDEGDRLVQTISIIGGREFPLPADIGFRPEGVNRAFVREVSRQDRAPVVGETYRLLVTYVDGTSEERDVSVTRLWTSAPVPVSPVGVGSVTPNFSWTAPEEPASSSFTYYVNVAGSFTGGVWWADSLPQSQMSIDWNANGEAYVPSLSSGVTYHWSVGVEDDEGNTAQTSVSFEVE